MESGGCIIWLRNHAKSQSNANPYQDNGTCLKIQGFKYFPAHLTIFVRRQAGGRTRLTWKFFMSVSCYSNWQL